MTEAKLAPNLPAWMAEGLVTLMTEGRKAPQRIASSTGGDALQGSNAYSLKIRCVEAVCQMTVDVECVVDG